MMVAQTYFGTDSLPSLVDTIHYDNEGNRISLVSYSNKIFENARWFTYNLHGAVIAEYFVNKQLDTMVNFYSCSYVRNELVQKVSSSGITNITYHYNSKSYCDYIISQGVSDDSKYIFGYPKIFEYEEYGNFNKLIKYKRNTPKLIIKTESNGLQSVLYSEQYTIRLGRITNCIVTFYNGDTTSIKIKYRGNQPVQLITPTIIIYARCNKNGDVAELTETKEGKTLERILFEYRY